MSQPKNQTIDKQNAEQEIMFEIPIITTSSPSMDTDSEASPTCKGLLKPSQGCQSDEEIDTSFININNNSTDSVNRRVSFLRSLSPGNLNTSGVSRGVRNELVFTVNLI